MRSGDDGARSRTASLVRLAGAAPAEAADDDVAREEPLEIRLHGTPIAVVMRTPGDDEDLVRGFLVTEGVLERADDLAGLARGEGEDGANRVDARLAPGVSVDLGALRRNLFASSSCGVCGKATIEGALRRAPALPHGPSVSRRVLFGLPAAMRERQATFERTGGLHAAALFDAGGALLALREDVGRHNAVDKALGALLGAGAGPASVLLVSGRVSFEVVQKALFGRVPIVCGISAPTSLAIDAAREGGITLLGFLRGETANAYTEPSRIA